MHVREILQRSECYGILKLRNKVLSKDILVNYQEVNDAQHPRFAVVVSFPHFPENK